MSVPQVEVEDGEEKWLFPCQEWLATNKADGEAPPSLISQHFRHTDDLPFQICRDLVPLSGSQLRRLKSSDSRKSIKEEMGLELSAALTAYHIDVSPEIFFAARLGAKNS